MMSHQKTEINVNISDRLLVDALLALREHNELGIAFELTCTQLHEYEISVTPEQRTRMAQIADRMQLDEKQLELFGCEE